MSEVTPKMGAMLRDLGERRGWLPEDHLDGRVLAGLIKRGLVETRRKQATRYRREYGIYGRLYSHYESYQEVRLSEAGRAWLDAAD